MLLLLVYIFPMPGLEVRIECQSIKPYLKSANYSIVQAAPRFLTLVPSLIEHYSEHTQSEMPHLSRSCSWRAVQWRCKRTGVFSNRSTRQIDSRSYILGAILNPLGHFTKQIVKLEERTPA